MLINLGLTESLAHEGTFNAAHGGLMTTKQMTLTDWKNLISQTKNMTGYTPAEIRRVSGQGQVMTNEDGSAFTLKAKELIEIQRLNSKGLQVIDINPQLASRSDNFCTYDGVTIHNLIGSENISNVVGIPNLYYDNPGAIVSVGAGVPAPYWRTVFIPLVGNFAKIEYLPSRIAVDNQNVSFLNQGINDYSNPQNTSELSYFTSPSTFFASNKLSSDRVLLVDFNQPTSSPIIAKHGDSFENYFNGVYLTFKQNSPRIRVTVGFNSKVHSQNDKPHNLNLWTGHGLTNNSTINPTPFCVSDADITVNGAGFDIGKGTGTIEFCLIANRPKISAYDVSGVSIFFINSFNAMMTVESKANSEVVFSDCDLIIKTLGAGAGLAGGSGREKRIASVTLSINMSNHTPGTVQFSEPIRICLREGTGLFVRSRCFYSSGQLQKYLKFSMSGYSMGPLYLDPVNTAINGNVNSAPFTTRYKFTENPYPIDFDDFGMPMA